MVDHTSEVELKAWDLSCWSEEEAAALVDILACCSTWQIFSVYLFGDVGEAGQGYTGRNSENYKCGRRGD